MNSYMVVATFKEGVTPEDIRALIPAEQVQAKLLEEQGLLGSKISMDTCGICSGWTHST